MLRSEYVQLELTLRKCEEAYCSRKTKKNVTKKGKR